MRFRFVAAWLAVGIALALGTTGQARAELKAPSCDALYTWLQSVKLNDRDLVTPYGRMAISKALQSEAMVELFGKSAREFSADEVTAASASVHVCTTAALKARDRAKAKVFGGLENEFKRTLAPTLKAIETGKVKLEAALDKLNADPAGRDTLRAAAALRQVTQGADLNASLNSLQGVDPLIARDVQGMTGVLREVPPAHWNERVTARLAERDAVLREAAVVDVGKEIAAVPATHEGIAALDNAVTKAKTELAGALAPEDLAKVDKLAADHHDTIEQALLVQLKTQVDTMPVSLDSIAALDALPTGPQAQPLNAARKTELAQYTLEKRKTMANSIVDSAVKYVASIPATFDGLVELANYTAQARANGGRFVGQDALQRFDAAVVARYEAIMGDAKSDFEKRLETTPESEIGLETLDAMSKGPLAQLRQLEPEISAPYAEKADARRKEIQEGIDEAAREAQERPLKGQTFGNPDGYFQLEFRSSSRVYMRNGPDLITEHEYDTDDDKVIIETPLGNIVFERRGATLVGQGMTLRTVEKID